MGHRFSHPKWQTPAEQEMVAAGEMSTWVLDKYITAMYWAYTTMTTVGYGDIVGSTFAEKIWCMATMVIGGFFLSFCFGRIASIVSRLDADRAARAEQLENVTQFLRDTELPKIISRKVLDFCKTNSKSVKPYDRTAVLARMPFELRTRILQHIYLPTIQNIPILQKLTVDEPSFLTDFSIRLQPYHSSADCFVFQRGELCTDLYILVRGEVHVVDAEKRTPLYKIQENSIFGETAVLQNIEASVWHSSNTSRGQLHLTILPRATAQGQVKSKHNESVYCTSAADMLRLPLEDAVELCSVYPQLLRGLARLASARQQQMRMSTSAAIPLATVSARLPTSPKSQAQCGSNSALDSAVTQLGLEILAMKQELAAQQAAHAAELEQMKVMLQQLPDTISRNMHTQ
ncbi:cyclic nucleotide-binding domain-containing protein [Haematococcus lacustris]|uniref:Cyclic nucleotide-binding domain-containing protein n=1 Tax=Haematococcus lacustris TaxID=44745 RepID=A0A699YP33_HAELA|nr:cyclic nucleotide-binding domain-containing protein [Haematococcus lacustris]